MDSATGSWKASTHLATTLLIEEGKFSSDQAFVLDEAIHELHPKNRFLDTGFYDYDPDMVK